MVKKPKINHDMTSIAIDGYNLLEGTNSPYLPTSNRDSAWHIGAHLRSIGEPSPFEVRPSRGITFHANGMKFKMVWSTTKTTVKQVD